MLLYTFLVSSFVRYKEYTICLISFNKLPELLPAFISARAVGNLGSICLSVSIFKPSPSCFTLLLASETLSVYSIIKLIAACLAL